MSTAERASRLFPPASARRTDLMIDRAAGAFVWTTDGRKILDFASGIGVTNVGHNNPRVVAAARAQLDKLVHMGHNIALYPAYLDLAERLVDLVGPDRKVFFSNSGAEALEGALKLAMRATGRTGLIAFKRSFHGRTIATTALSASAAKYRSGYQGVMPNVYHVDYPAPFISGLDADAEVERCLRELDETFALLIAPGDVAAIVVEPMQGEGGYHPAPAVFLQGLRERADEHGIALIFDEIQSGFGRTGRMFAYEHSGVMPDIMTLAKGIANGFPLSAIIARTDMMDKWPAGAHGGTFGGNPMACAAALAVIDVLEEGGLENARVVGDQLRGGLEQIASAVDHITDVRGLGMMLGIEFRNRDGSPATGFVSLVCEHALDNGLLLLTCGPEGNVLRLMPPTTLSAEEAADAIRILLQSVGQANA
ncbi:MAG: aminotransferase class III-fold pyridoxal phosphate-dependent enzyme [Homoserinimonas sp.]